MLGTAFSVANVAPNAPPFEYPSAIPPSSAPISPISPTVSANSSFPRASNISAKELAISDTSDATIALLSNSCFIALSFSSPLGAFTNLFQASAKYPKGLFFLISSDFLAIDLSILVNSSPFILNLLSSSSTSTNIPVPLPSASFISFAVLANSLALLTRLISILCE